MNDPVFQCNPSGKNELDHLISPLLDEILIKLATNPEEAKRGEDLKQKLIERMNYQFYLHCQQRLHDIQNDII